MWKSSALPMPSRISTPQRSSHWRCSGSGSFSPAESTRRRLDRSRAPPSASRASILPIMVGTEVRIVGFERSTTSKSVSGVLRSLKSAVLAPTAKGNMRFVPVA